MPKIFGYCTKSLNAGTGSCDQLSGEGEEGRGADGGRTVNVSGYSEVITAGKRGGLKDNLVAYLCARLCSVRDTYGSTAVMLTGADVRAETGFRGRAFAAMVLAQAACVGRIGRESQGRRRHNPREQRNQQHSGGQAIHGLGAGPTPVRNNRRVSA